MEEQLLQLLPGGTSVVAVILIVRYFLSHIEASSTRAEGVVARFTDQLNEIRTSFQEQVSSLTMQVCEVSRETGVALKGLESAVRELRERIEK